MLRFIFSKVVFFVLVIGLFGCGTEESRDSSSSDERLINSEETNQDGEFEVSIHVGNDSNDLEVYGTISYIGDKDKINIFHGGSIFFFHIYEVNGDFEHIGGMDQPLLRTTLTKDEAHKVTFIHPVLDELEPGDYEFEAIADFSLDEDNIVNTQIEIPVSTIVEID
ncbi:hypothetical protein [Evansella cellulosilytica]|uniref:Intracellular proteinase inhibitor BsuPI domain-containing protein n=1 Tax=Evansella cellulosilytica (strain ATCC 21833 / DSM 2522 / FERM P-1141 / JCM 9156 / N-4) TaxID=649639 RepID=E6TU19_EVAC2|nr:hypothetical protein [Evansella cellulosilytica]ADU32050.1 hypothetical protein Bcell_3811 [Evansella cellulosilytica DSM 2522]